MEQPPAPRRLAQAVRQWFRASFTLDVRGLAAFRCLLGVVLVADCLLRARDFGLMFTPDGIFPPDLIRSFHGTPAKWSLAFLSDAAWCGGLVLAAEGVAGALLALGCWTRLATVAAWVATASVVQRTAPATNAGDLWLVSLLFWSMFLPLGAAWSMDARGRNPASGPPATAVCSIATAALVLQVAAVYFGAGLAKCNATWFSGEALAHALSVHDHGRPLGMLVGGVSWLSVLLTWTVLGVELVAPILLVACPTLAVRTALVAVFGLLHIAIWATMTVGLFAWVGITAWLPLVPGPVWDTLVGRPTTAPVACVARLGRGASLACGAAILLAGVSFAHFRGWLGAAALPRPVAAAIAACCLEQEWSMFGAVPLQVQWVYGRGLLADGRVVDLLRGGRPLERERPAGGFGSLPSHRWHKFFWILPRPRVRVFAEPTAAALAHDWNTQHAEREQVQSLEIRYAVQGTTAADAPLQDMLVAAWPPRGGEGQGNLDRLLESASFDPAADDPRTP